MQSAAQSKAGFRARVALLLGGDRGANLRRPSNLLSYGGTSSPQMLLLHMETSEFPKQAWSCCVKTEARKESDCHFIP